LGFSKFVFDSVSHVGVLLPNHSISPLSLRERASEGLLIQLFKLEFNSVSLVGVPLPNTSISPLSLRERARVRGS
jgi:hypothetical protein